MIWQSPIALWSSGIGLEIRLWGMKFGQDQLLKMVVALYSTKRKFGEKYKASGVQLKASNIKSGTSPWMVVDETLNIPIASDSDFS